MSHGQENRKSNVPALPWCNLIYTSYLSYLTFQGTVKVIGMIIDYPDTDTGKCIYYQTTDLVGKTTNSRNGINNYS